MAEDPIKVAAALEAARPKARNPGDEAPLGSPGTGLDVCPVCHGEAQAAGEPCLNCGGTGRVVKVIGAS